MIAHSPALAPVPRAVAGYFGAPRPRFGWLHRPARARGIGLVIVPPFGYEAICAHRPLRHLAEAAAKAGLVAVRLDLDGCGDSAGDELDPDRWQAWLASIADACDLARAHGADRLVLAGVRLGATLAAQAAERRADVTGVVAIAAVPSGKALVREGRALQMALALAPPPAGVAAPPEDVHELVGFALPAELRAAIAAADLAAAARAPAPAVLVIDRDDLPPNDRWVAALRALGADVEHARLPGYVEMVLDPHKAQVPHAIVDATVAFAAARPAAGSVVAPRAQVGLVPRVELAGGVAEEAVQLDDHLFAIATRPRGTASRAVILLDAGAIHRVGPNRLYVALARRLAARGELVIRLDASGLGDSATRAGSVENVVYGEHAIADVGVAVAWARRAGASRVAVVGLCSGAYHALKAAVAGQPIDTVVPINPLTFFWQPGTPLDFAEFRVTETAARYQKSVGSIAAWGKLLRGEVDVARVARVLAGRVRSVAVNRAKDAARRLRVPLRDDLGSELLALARRSVAIRFVFAGDDPGRAMLAEQGGSAVSRLVARGALAIEVIPAPDHTFTPRWSHPLLLAAIERAVAA